SSEQHQHEKAREYEPREADRAIRLYGPCLQPAQRVAGTARRLSGRIDCEVDNMRVEPLRHGASEVVQPIAHDQPFVQLVHVVLALDQRRYRSPYVAERL